VLISDPLHDLELQLPSRELPEGAKRLGDGSQAGKVQVGADRRHDQVVGARQGVLPSMRATGISSKDSASHFCPAPSRPLPPRATTASGTLERQQTDHILCLMLSCQFNTKDYELVARRVHQA
jgi:hypothetical protein